MEEKFIPPKSENTIIWRYMDFTKFMFLIENNALFFPRSTFLPDKYEGYYPDLQAEKLKQAHTNWIESSSLPEKIKEDSKSVRSEETEIKSYICINSWHMNEFESDALWGIYSKEGKGISICSTYKLLKETLNSNNRKLNVEGIGIVNYIDFNKESIPENNLFYRFMYKRINYKHENELMHIPDQSIPPIPVESIPFFK